MTKFYIINPRNGKLNTIQEWRQYVADNEGADIEEPEYVCIVPESKNTPFVFSKKSLGYLPWKEAMKAASKFRFRNLPGHENDIPSLPTRRQGLAIADCNVALFEGPDYKLCDMLKEIGGDADMAGWYWTPEKSNASSAWFFYGSNGALYNYYVTSAFRCQAVTLYPEAAQADGN